MKKKPTTFTADYKNCHCGDFVCRLASLLLLVFAYDWVTSAKNKLVEYYNVIGHQNENVLIYFGGFQTLFYKQLSSDRALLGRVPQLVCGLHCLDHLLQGHRGPRCSPSCPSGPHCAGDRRAILPAQTGKFKCGQNQENQTKIFRLFCMLFQMFAILLELCGCFSQFSDFLNTSWLIKEINIGLLDNENNSYCEKPGSLVKSALIVCC